MELLAHYGDSQLRYQGEVGPFHALRAAEFRCNFAPLRRA